LDTVVISDGEKGDRLAESSEVKVSVREASKSTGCSESERTAPKSATLEEPSPFHQGEGQRRRRRNWVYAADEIPGVSEGDMSRRNDRRKLGTTRGSPRRSRTAKALRISRGAMKSQCAHEWGGWGRLSVDGLGQHNPDRSEGPWGHRSEVAVIKRTHRPDLERDSGFRSRDHEGRLQTDARGAYAGNRLKRYAHSGRHRLRCPPLSRIGENPPYGM
jgi:hypothetical protein